MSINYLAGSLLGYFIGGILWDLYRGEGFAFVPIYFLCLGSIHMFLMCRFLG